MSVLTSLSADLLFDIFLNHITPILFSAGIGFLFGKVFHPDVKTLARVAFYVFSPCLVFTGLTTSGVGGGEFWRLAAFTASVITVSGTVAWVAARVFGFSRSLTAALILSNMFVNSGNYGLPLNLFAFGEPGLAHALIYFSTSTLFVYSIGVFIASRGRRSTREALLGVLKVPALYALAAAGIALALDADIPVIVGRPIGVLAQAAIPVMLILLGMQLGRATRPQQWSWIGLAAGLRLLIAPLIAFSLARFFQLTGPARQAGVVEASMPTAVITTILALEYDVEPSLVTGAVFVTTLGSPLVLTPLVAILQTG